jgi:hypothetical protein
MALASNLRAFGASDILSTAALSASIAGFSSHLRASKDSEHQEILSIKRL